MGQVVWVLTITEQQAVTDVCTGGTCFAFGTGLREFPRSLQADGGTVSAPVHDLGNTFFPPSLVVALFELPAEVLEMVQRLLLARLRPGFCCQNGRRFVVHTQ